MRLRLAGVAAALLVQPQPVSADDLAQPAPTDCPTDGNLFFLCGATKPEDLRRIPGTRYLVASGFSPGASLKLVDTRAKRFVRWYNGTRDQIAPDFARYPDCSSPPDPALINTRGLSMRQIRPGISILHAVNHGGREAVEVFEVAESGRRAPPRLRWKGCLRLPSDHVGNAVATYSDGTVLVSVLTLPGKTITDFERGQNTGAIFERTPDETQFRLIAGTGLPGNNGLETASDDSGFYTVAFGLRAIALFRRGKTTGPDAIVPAPGFMPDNIHRDGKRLIAAGMNSDEPACGGKRRIVDGVADTMLCPRGWKVAELDPGKRKFRLIAQGKRSTGFNGVSQAAIIGKTLWLGSYQADRMAFLRWR